MLSQLNALWQNRHILAVDAPDIDAGGEGVAAMTWRPWEHIHPHPKGTPAPQVNPSGKYCVRLYWMVSMIERYVMPLTIMNYTLCIKLKLMLFKTCLLACLAILYSFKSSLRE